MSNIFDIEVCQRGRKGQIEKHCPKDTVSSSFYVSAGDCAGGEEPWILEEPRGWVGMIRGILRERS